MRRESARVLLVDGRDRLLLLRCLLDPGKPALGTVWVPPGGGFEEGERPAEAAVRELFEETGLPIGPNELGTAVALASGPMELGGETVDAHDTFFFYRVNHHDVDTSGFGEPENSAFREFRWWSVSELARTRETIFPVGVAGLLTDLLVGKRPGEPVRLPWG